MRPQVAGHFRPQARRPKSHPASRVAEGITALRWIKRRLEAPRYHRSNGPRMSASIDPKLGVNSWLEDELYQQYLHDRRTVDESWKEVFESDGHTVNGHENGTPAAPAVSDPTVQAQPAPAPAPAPAPGEELVPLRGAASRIAENMTASLSIPVATSQRTIAVMVIDENRRVINQHRTLHGQGKISYT